MNIKNIILTYTFILYLQPNTSKAQKHWSDLQHLGYNVAISGLIGGISGMINKNDKQSAWEAFYTNFLKSGLGGGIIYSAKRTLPIISNKFDNALGYWGNRMLMNLGHSMVYNASLNRELLESYYLEFYGVSMRFKLKDDFNFSAKISGANILMIAAQGIIFKGIFDIAKTLKYGVFYFDMSQNMYEMSNNAGGFAMRNMIYIDPKLKNLEYRQTVVHELIHTYQFMDFTSTRNMLNPIGEKYIFTEDSIMKNISTYINFDLPAIFAIYSFSQDYDTSTVEAESDFYMTRVH